MFLPSMSLLVSTASYTITSFTITEHVLTRPYMIFSIPIYHIIIYLTVTQLHWQVFFLANLPQTFELKPGSTQYSPLCFCRLVEPFPKHENIGWRRFLGHIAVYQGAALGTQREGQAELLYSSLFQDKERSGPPLQAILGFAIAKRKASTRICRVEACANPKVDIPTIDFLGQPPLLVGEKSSEGHEYECSAPLSTRATNQASLLTDV